MNPLFRQQAIAKVSNPDQLDQALRVVKPQHLLGFVLISLVMLAGLVWSMVSTAPVKASGPGVLLSAAGVASLTAPDAGHIDKLLVKAGDRIEVGQPIALISHAERRDGMNAAAEEALGVQGRRQALQEEIAVQDRMQTALMKEMRKAQQDRLASLEEQRTALTKRHEGEARLRAQGMITAVMLFETENQLAQTNNEIAIAHNRLSELALNLEQQASKRRQDLAELRINAQNLTRRADNLRQEYDRDSRVVAINAGAIAEISVDVNDRVVPGQVIARVLVDDPGAAGLTAIAYLPAADGKKVKPQMEALVTPSTVKVELDGYVRGRVLRVAELPASREGLLRRLKNAAQVEEILKAGTPFEVEVELQRDNSTPSGYAWTSGQGPDIRIEPGTIARTEIVVGRVHLISLLFPAMDYVLGWFKAL